MFLEVGQVVRIIPRNHISNKLMGVISSITPSFDGFTPTIYRISVKDDPDTYAYGTKENTYLRESHEIERVSKEEAMLWKLENA